MTHEKAEKLSDVELAKFFLSLLQQGVVDKSTQLIIKKMCKVGAKRAKTIQDIVCRKNIRVIK